MHVIRTSLERATHKGYGLARAREQVLKVAARVLLHGRRITVVIASEAAALWSQLWQQLARLHVPEVPIRGA